MPETSTNTLTDNFSSVEIGARTSLSEEVYRSTVWRTRLDDDDAQFNKVVELVGTRSRILRRRLQKPPWSEPQNPARPLTV